MIYADVYVREPLEKIVDDWNFFDEKIVGKFTRFLTLLAHNERPGKSGLQFRFVLSLDPF